MKRISYLFGGLLMGLLFYAGFRPAEYNISREILISKSAEDVFPFLDSAEKSNEWMPWKASDPKMQIRFEGPSHGVGSAAKWVSDGPMGKGESKVLEIVPNQKVVTLLKYFEPMAMEQTAEFSLTPKPDGVLLRWSVSGENGFMGRLFTIFMSMDDMVGKEFEKGLQNLKQMMEK